MTFMRPTEGHHFNPRLGIKMMLLPEPTTWALGRPIEDPAKPFQKTLAKTGGICTRLGLTGVQNT